MKSPKLIAIFACLAGFSYSFGMGKDDNFNDLGIGDKNPALQEAVSTLQIAIGKLHRGQLINRRGSEQYKKFYQDREKYDLQPELAHFKTARNLHRITLRNYNNIVVDIGLYVQRILGKNTFSNFFPQFARSIKFSKLRRVFRK